MTTLAHPTTAGLPAPTSSVSPLAAVRHSLTLAWRSLVQIKHNPMELLDLSLQPLMFVLLFAFVFGGALSGSPKAFLQFGLAGIITQNALFLTMNTAVALNTDITKGVFDRFRSLPIARSAPLAGRIAADVVRQAWSVGILLGVGSILGFRVHTGFASAVGAIALLFGFTLAFSWLPVLIGMLVSEPAKVQVFGFTVLFPLTFASSAFVPTSTMPGWMQAWVKVNPVTLLTDSLRGLLVSGPVARPLFGALAWAVGIMLVFAPLTSVASPRTRTLQPVQVASSTPSTSNATRAPRLATSSLVPSSVRNSTVCWSKTKLTGSAIGPRSSTSTTRPRCRPASSPKHSSLVSSCQRISCTPRPSCARCAPLVVAPPSRRMLISPIPIGIGTKVRRAPGHRATAPAIRAGRSTSEPAHPAQRWVHGLASREPIDPTRCCRSPTHSPSACRSRRSGEEELSWLGPTCAAAWTVVGAEEVGGAVGEWGRAGYGAGHPRA